MLAERWQEIERLYHTALELGYEERGRYLEKACGGDEELRREVDSLLASDDEAANFLESKEQKVDEVPPAARIAGGTRIGSSMILEFLRAGGMGEVKRATHGWTGSSPSSFCRRSSSQMQSHSNVSIGKLVLRRP